MTFFPLFNFTLNAIFATFSREKTGKKKRKQRTQNWPLNGRAIRFHCGICFACTVAHIRPNRHTVAKVESCKSAAHTYRIGKKHTHTHHRPKECTVNHAAIIICHKNITYATRNVRQNRTDRWTWLWLPSSLARSLARPPCMSLCVTFEYEFLATYLEYAMSPIFLFFRAHLCVAAVVVVVVVDIFVCFSSPNRNFVYILAQ